MAPTSVGPIIFLSQIHRNTNNLTVSATVNTVQYTLTIDTGASHSIIRSDMVSDNVVPLSGVRLRTATGENAAVVGTVNLRVCIGNSVFDHEFIVANIIDEIIIGMDFMASHGIVLDMKEMMMKLGNVDIPLNSGYSPETEIKQILVSNDEVLPPNAESIVWINKKEISGANRLCLIEPTNNIRDIMVGKTLVNFSYNNAIPIRVMNLSKNPKILKKGTEIAKCSGIEAVMNTDVKLPIHSNSRDSSDFDMSGILQQFSNRLSKSENRKAQALLKKYASLFQPDTSRNGKPSIVKHQINTGEARPIRQAPRSIPLAKRDEVKNLIDEMERNGVIEPSSSPWSSPVVLVKKKDGTTRFCVDYRKLNDVTKKDSYPLPRIDDTLDTLAGSKWFSTLDLKSGYWQVDIEKSDREKTAFSVGNGLWQFTVMPFGLCNAPATFERLMERVLSGLHWKACLVYLDDIIVVGRSFEEHLSNLEKVFQRISRARLTLNPKKCSFLQKEVKYLGHKVSEYGIETDDEKIAAVKTWPRPKDLSQLRSFLGLCTYYRRFVPGFSIIASPLHELSRKNQQFNWQQRQEEAFQKLKMLLCNAPVLSYPIPGKMFILDTDASNTGIGGVLSQNIDGQERVIAYYSRTLGHAERNYCVTRRELLAALECMKHFHKYLYGQKFRLRTDHAALRWLLQFKNPEGQLARWIERIQAYDVEIEHRKGGLHSNADALSRRPCCIECKHCSKAESKEGFVDVRLLSLNSSDEWSMEQIMRDQENDSDLKQIIEAMRADRRPTKQEMASQSPIAKVYWSQWQSLTLRDGCLHRVWESDDGKSHRHLIVVPKCRISKVLNEFHNGASGGHLGVNKTFAKIRQRFYWVGCRQSILDWVQSCKECMKAKGPSTRSRGRMMQYNSGSPFERIAMDVAGPFPTSAT
ncbi:MAG: reverse transcriptase domain-containing protein, partial [Fervidobacterium sp.]